MKIRKMAPEHISASAKWLKPYEYEIIAEAGTGLCLPEEKKYQLKIAINEFSLITDSLRESKKNYCRWSKRFD